MPKIRAHSVEAHRALVWGQLLDAFEEMLLTHDYADVSISAVAARAGVARNTVYNYADDKGELLAGAARRHIGRLSGIAAAVSEPQPDERLRAMLRACGDAFGNGKVSPKLFQELMRHGTATEFARAADGASDLLPLIVTTIREGAAAGIFAPVRDELYTLDLIVSVMITALEAGFDNPSDAPACFDDAIAFVMRALRA